MLQPEVLNKIGLDTEEGLAYCADDPEFYLEMLWEYLNESAGRRLELERYYADRNWNLYGISAHALKSTSRMIGARAFSERAHAMELAGKEGDEAAVVSGHEQFMREYGELIDALSSAVRLMG